MCTEVEAGQKGAVSVGESTAGTARYHHLTVGRLVRAAQAGDQAAWGEMVKRYGRLVTSTARNSGLSVSDAADVSQTTWLHLWESLPYLRQPERVGAWLAVTARHEALRVRRNARRLVLTGEEETPRFEPETPPADLGVLTAERDSELWKAVDELPKRCQDLLRVLVADPPLNYREISTAFGMPIGSIGPTRARCLDCLRRMAKQLAA
jgi:RNA polymerase sigma factor (sigma-70 family)